MKYKYRLKNKEIENALGVIFGKECVEDELQRQMSNDSYFLYLAIDSEDGVKGAIKVSKREIERVRTYDSENWNPFPEVDPPKDGRYLVFVNYCDAKYIDVDNYTIDKGWKTNEDDDILAFRPLNVEPPAPEELND